MKTQSNLDNLIPKLHQAAFEPSLWPDVLAEICSTVGSHSGIVLVHNKTSHFPGMVGMHNIDSQRWPEYSDYYHRLDYWAQRAPSGNFVATGSDLVSAEEHRASEFYNDFLLKQDIGGIIASGFTMGKQLLVSVGLHRRVNSEEFSATHKQMLATLMPHLHTALLACLRIEDLKRLAAIKDQTLNRTRIGIVYLDKKGYVVEMNDAANRYVNRRRGVRIQRGKLIADCHFGDSIAVDTNLSYLSKDLHTLGSGRVRTNFLTRDSNGRPAFNVMVVAVPKDSQPILECGARSPDSIVFLVDVDLDRHVSEALLVDKYGLTASEARLAKSLCKTHDIGEAARQNKISLQHGRTRLKVIMGKVGVSKQSELIARLFSDTLLDAE